MVSSEERYVVGLDVGTSKVAAIVGEARDDGSLDVIGVGLADSRGIRRGVVVNLEAAVESIKKALQPGLAFRLEILGGVDAARSFLETLPDVSGVKVDGEARSANDYAEVKKALTGPMPTGLTILNDHVRPPLADPYVFAASLGPDTLVLTGSVPSEERRKDLKELARRLFERPMLDDQLQLASGAPKRWNDAVEAALRALSRLDSGKISISGLALSIEGLAPDKGTAVAVSYQLKRDLPSLFSSSESIKWKEADMSGSAGAMIVPRINEIIQTDNGQATGSLPLSPKSPRSSN